LLNDVKTQEAELITMLKQGSEEAFKSLYDMYAKRLYAFCLEYTKSREDTEEIVQDAFVWLWKNRSSIRQETTIKNLIFLRVRHFLINAWRTRLKEPVFEDYVDYINLLQDKSSDRLEYDEFLSTVKSILDRLPRTQARVVMMSRIEGFKNKEIAQKLRLSEQTVKNSLSVGLKSLKEELGKMIILVLSFIITCL
jgi:RNA polymerase sigma-70 factor (ECF subfamily)